MPISRLFTNSRDAASTVTELKKAGFGETRVQVIAKTGDHVSVDNIVRQGIGVRNARSYAKRIHQGEVLLIVDAPFGYAARATAILQRARGGDGAVTDATSRQATYEGVVWDEATPLSSALGIPVLTHEAAPFSSFWHIPTLSRRQSGKRHSFGLPTLSHNPAPLSSALGLATLSHNAAPFSSALGLATLSHNAAPLSRLLSMATLSRRAAPLSKALGLPVLTNNATPLSDAVHAPVLADDNEKRPSA